MTDFEQPNDLGPQPLDELMTRLGITNADLVRASAQQLTHKMVAKGRKGRRLTPNVQEKILAAIHSVHPQRPLTFPDLFNY
jgi:hypothetical protein